MGSINAEAVFIDNQCVYSNAYASLAKFLPTQINNKSSRGASLACPKEPAPRDSDTEEERRCDIEAARRSSHVCMHAHKETPLKLLDC